jgi:DNA-binding transcriptional LysR family regulator
MFWLLVFATRRNVALSRRTSRLGAQLLRRTWRSLSVTEAGQNFYESAVRLVDDLETAVSRVGRGQTAPSGLIGASDRAKRWENREQRSPGLECDVARAAVAHDGVTESQVTERRDVLAVGQDDDVEPVGREVLARDAPRVLRGHGEDTLGESAAVLAVFEQ